MMLIAECLKNFSDYFCPFKIQITYLMDILKEARGILFESALLGKIFSKTLDLALIGIFLSYTLMVAVNYFPTVYLIAKKEAPRKLFYRIKIFELVQSLVLVLADILHLNHHINNFLSQALQTFISYSILADLIIFPITLIIYFLRIMLSKSESSVFVHKFLLGAYLFLAKFFICGILASYEFLYLPAILLIAFVFYYRFLSKREEYIVVSMRC